MRPTNPNSEHHSRTTGAEATHRPPRNPESSSKHIESRVPAPAGPGGPAGGGGGTAIRRQAALGIECRRHFWTLDRVYKTLFDAGVKNGTTGGCRGLHTCANGVATASAITLSVTAPPRRVRGVREEQGEEFNPRRHATDWSFSCTSLTTCAT